jgi:hypothetical protein
MIHEFDDYMNKVLRVPSTMKVYKDSSEVYDGGGLHPSQPGFTRESK